MLLWQATERNLIVVVDGNQEAETLGELVETFFDILVASDMPRPQMIPALDVIPSQRLSPHNEIAEQRAVGLWRLASGRVRSPSRRSRPRCCAPNPRSFTASLR